MLTLEKEQAADQIFGRTQWWRSGATTFLVRFSRDEERCGIFVSGDAATPRAEALFEALGLSGEAEVILEPGIDCHAIGCRGDQLSAMLQRLAAAVE
jgi:hypothetical protein